MRYLLNDVVAYRVETVEEALLMRDEAHNADEYDLNTFTYTTKYDKKADEEYQVVKIKRIFNAEKNPEDGYMPEYLSKSSRIVLNVAATYRTDTLEDALLMRDEAQDSNDFELQSFSYVSKYDRKADEEYQVVKMKKIYNNEKSLERVIETGYADEF